MKAAADLAKIKVNKFAPNPGKKNFFVTLLVRSCYCIDYFDFLFYCVFRGVLGT